MTPPRRLYWVSWISPVLRMSSCHRPWRWWEQRYGGGLFVVLESLGRSDSLLTIDNGHGKRQSIRLSPRHSEILLLLASAARGLSGDELAVLLYEEDGSASTLRA